MAVSCYMVFICWFLKDSVSIHIHVCRLDEIDFTLYDDVYKDFTRGCIVDSQILCARVVVRGRFYYAEKEKGIIYPVRSDCSFNVLVK